MSAGPFDAPTIDIYSFANTAAFTTERFQQDAASTANIENL